MKVPLLSKQEVLNSLAKVPGWIILSDKLHREFQFADFSEAFAFMTRVALVAEAMNHHPDWSNVWNRVTIDLNTHAVGGITHLDFELAAKVDKLAPGAAATTTP